MKKIISLFICLIVFISITIPAYATNIDLIQPNGNIIFNNNTNINNGSYSYYNNGSLIVIPVNNSLYTSNPIIEQTPINQTTNIATKPVEEVNNEDTPIIPNEEQSIEYNINTEKLIEEIFNLVNKARQENNIPILKYNKEIQEAADIRAKEASESFSHTRPDGSSCHDIIKLEYYATGENLLMADKEIATAENMMKTWMDSEGHRANILLKDFTEMAIGIYETNNIIYATQIFLG